MADKPGWTMHEPGPRQSFDGAWENAPPPDAGDPGWTPPPGMDSGRRARRGENNTLIWPEPVDFFATDNGLRVPVLQEGHVPAALWLFALDTADRMGADPATVALVALASCASVISDVWVIQPKRKDWSWTEQARLWVAIVGPPSILKSPILAAATKPIDDLEREARHRHADEMREYRTALAEWKEAKKAKAEDLGPEPQAPRLDRYMVEGTTVEALSEVLRDDAEAKQRAPQGKVLVRQDEMSEFFASFDRYKGGGKGGGDRGAWLRIYNGGSYIVDRVVRGQLYISNWSACVAGGIQPDPIQKVANDTAEDGLLQRLTYAVPEGQGVGMDRAPDKPACDRYKALFPALAALRPPKKFGTDFDSAVVLHDAAHEHREDINSLARAVSSLAGTSRQMQAALGKWPGLFARLLLTFHLIEVADARASGDIGPPLLVVPEETARMVADYMADILLPHLMRAEAVMYSTKEVGHAREIGGLILEKRYSRITTRDVHRGCYEFRAGDSKHMVPSVMASLVAVGWLEPEVPENPVKPVNSWLVNPKVHELFKARAEERRVQRIRATEAAADDMERYRRRQAKKKDAA